jgi:hypothetical protein
VTLHQWIPGSVYIVYRWSSLPRLDPHLACESVITNEWQFEEGTLSILEIYVLNGLVLVIY